MKNKLQRLLVITGLFIGICFVAYQLFDSFILLTLFLEAVSFFLCGYLVLIDKRPSTAKIAWLFTILFFPYMGLLLFFLIGNNPVFRRFSSVQKENERLLHQGMDRLLKEHPEIFSEPYSISKELTYLSGNEPLSGNQITHLSDGEQAYQELLRDLKTAKHHIHLMYFIYKADETGRELAEVLIEKAKQGVEVRFIYDSVGSIKLPFEFIDRLKEAGIFVRAYDLVNSPSLSTRINWRNHRKMVIIDGRIAHIGGMNLGNEYRSITNKFAYWRDTNLKIIGPSTIYVQYVFLLDWLFLNEDDQALNPFFQDQEHYFPLEKVSSDAQTEICQLIFGGPYDSERTLRDSIMELFGKAEKSIQIATPYFVPDEESLSVIRRAARCGLKVQLIIPGKGDRGISYYGNNSFIDRLLSAGVEVYAYDSTAFLHCKYLIVDGQVASVGSTNFDMRSFHLNHELSAFLYGPSPVVSEIQSQFEEDLRRSKRLTSEDQKKRKVLTIVKERLSEFLTPLL
ncbi:MAG: cardiolipin synthase [Enterococcus sp.]